MKPIIYNFQWNVGSHVQWRGNLEQSIKWAVDQGMYSLQFFLGSPKSFNRKRVTSEDVLQAQKIVERYPTSIFSHAPYLYNLCGRKACLAWNGNSEQDMKLTHILKELEYELNILANFTVGGNGVIIHPGNYPDRDLGLRTIVKSINKINFAKNSKLLLENSAGQGTSLATTLEEIKVILDNVEENKKEHVGVCIDTCHLFSYGDYDLSIVSEVDRFFKDFENIIGIRKLNLIHLNDSMLPLGCKKDRHAGLGQGYIWRSDITSLIHLLNKCSEYGLPLVLETSPSDMFFIKLLYENL